MQVVESPAVNSMAGGCTGRRGCTITTGHWPGSSRPFPSTWVTDPRDLHCQCEQTEFPRFYPWQWSHANAFQPKDLLISPLPFSWKWDLVSSPAYSHRKCRNKRAIVSEHHCIEHRVQSEGIYAQPNQRQEKNNLPLEQQTANRFQRRICTWASSLQLGSAPRRTADSNRECWTKPQASLWHRYVAQDKKWAAKELTSKENHNERFLCTSPPWFFNRSSGKEVFRCCFKWEGHLFTPPFLHFCYVTFKLKLKYVNLTVFFFKLMFFHQVPLILLLNVSDLDNDSAYSMASPHSSQVPLPCVSFASQKKCLQSTAVLLLFVSMVHELLGRGLFPLQTQKESQLSLKWEERK